MPVLASRQSKYFAITAIVAATALGVSSFSSPRAQSSPDAGVRSFSRDRLLEHIRKLSSDEFEGRGPGTKGEAVTLAYLEKQFRDAGLEPGNPDRTYLEKVPLVGIRPDPNMELTITGHGTKMHAAFQKDFVAWTKRTVDSVQLDADMIFVGYGVQAPEYEWDDFKGVDVKGKWIVVLINDPPLQDERKFGGKAMTYYGRWTYKFEKAAELGASGCLIVHETDPAGYPWEVVRNSWSAEQFDLVSPDRNMHRAAVEGWITHETAQALFAANGQSFDALKRKAVSADFRPVPLGMKAQIEIHNSLRTIESHNVIAKRTGSDPRLKNEYVIYTAHWDHFGIGPEVNGDRIYHGAADNASGTAALLEIARAYEQLKIPPRRTILFLSVTAEEQGLLGSRYYAEHPLYPIERTAADINMDGMNQWGPTRDITIVGSGKSTLDDVVATVAHEQGRTVKPDPEPEKGFYFRSDHFSFAKVGVPALDPDSGIDYVGKPAGWGIAKRREYTANDYHKPSDVVKPDWDLRGAIEDSVLYYLVGHRVADQEQMPQWKPNAEFRAIREASLKHQPTN
jgi:Zn-dependent M28 family amino/carboxypeptidase